MKALLIRIALDMLFGLFMAAFFITLLCAFAVATDGAECRVTTCLDGDTFVADIDLGFGVTLSRQTVRVYGYDAWETSHHRHTIRYAPDEFERGRAAKAALEKLFTGAAVTVEEVPGKHDPYGRRLLSVYADGKEIGAILRKAGHERKNP